MRSQIDPSGGSLIFNDVNPADPSNYWSTLTIAKEMVEQKGHLFVLKCQLDADTES